MTPAELYKAGKLSEAVAAATAAVKGKPTDIGARGLLAELLSFSDDFTRADKQLEALLQMDPKVVMGVMLFRQIVHGAQARQDFYTQGRVPEFLQPPGEELQLRLKASIAIREGDMAGAGALLAEADTLLKPIGGTCDGVPFDDIRDLDDLTASVFEVITSTGKFYWIPMSQVEAIEFHAPERPRDLLWRRARMVVRGGPDGEVFLPSLYAGSAAAEDENIRLGRATDWQGDDGQPIRGLGQRCLLVGEVDKPIIEIETIEFNEPAS